MATDGALGEQEKLATLAGVSAVGRSGADLTRDLKLVQAGLAATSGEGAARLDQLVNEAIIDEVWPPA